MEKEIITEQRFTMLEVKLDKLTEKVQDIADDIKSHVKSESEKYEKFDTKLPIIQKSQVPLQLQQRQTLE